MWTVEKAREEFGEDVLRDLCRDINDLMCGRAGHGHDPNRIGIDPDVWRVLLRAGGYTESGVEKAMVGDTCMQNDTDGPFTPYTIRNLVNLSSVNGGPLSPEHVNHVLERALSWRQLIQP